MLKAGFAEADITPEVPCAIGGYGDYFAEEVLSPLFARALFVQGHGSSWAIASADLIGLDRHEICLPVIEKLREKGFDGGVLLTASHTHSGPHTRFNAMYEVRRRDDAYIERLKAVLVDIILQARGSAAPAEMAAGRTFTAENINRRVNLDDGSHHYLPLEKHLYQYATGPRDEELGVVAFRDADSGVPIATLLNYTAHALVIGDYKWVVTADYPGVFVDEFKSLSGTPAVFTQGACGDIHPYGFETGPRRMRQMGRRLAEKAFEVWKTLSYRADAPVGWARRDVSLPVQKRMYEGDSDYSPRWRDLDKIDTDVTVANVGEAAFIGVPGELFAETGMTIKRGSPFPFTYILYNTNSYASYIPTTEAYKEGGYEPNSTLVGPGGALIIEQTGTQMALELANPNEKEQ